MRLSGVCVDALVALLREEDLIVVCVSRCCENMLDLGRGSIPQVQVPQVQVHLSRTVARFYNPIVKYRT